MLRSAVMASRREDLEACEEALGYRFRQRELMEAALTHRSYAHEVGLEEHYERLEFLGDAVIGLVAADWLYRSHADRPEGELSKTRSHLVSETVLARIAERLDIGACLRLGVGEARSGGRHKRSLLADAFEALLGAVFLDGGFPAASRVAVPLLEEVFADPPRRAEGDAKTALQELTQAKGWDLPEYLQVAEEGPDHSKRFSIECRIQGRSLGVGRARTKKGAEQRAAAAALAELSEI